MRRRAGPAAAGGLAALVALAAGAAGQEGGPPPSEPADAEPPFSAEEIREATAVGRRYVFRVADGSGAERRTRMEFVAVDDEGCTVLHVLTDAEGEPLAEPAEERSTWAELESHGRFPRDRTTVEAGEVEVPAGTYACRVFTVTAPARGDAEQEVSTYWFADELPGAPVKLVVEVDGAEVWRMELLEHHPGE